MYYFTADLHLGHANIINYCARPFKNADEMDSIIVRNFVETIKAGDSLYILGDLSFDTEKATRFLSNFPKESIHYIRGNHDKNITKGFMKNFCVSYHNIEDIKIEGQKITLCHYAMRTWNGSCHGTWQLFGHSHGKLAPRKGKQFDVGVDTNGFKPYSFEDVKRIMATLPENEDYLAKEKK
jgi:calcineurin-like phosphoesterase family protein